MCQECWTKPEEEIEITEYLVLVDDGAKRRLYKMTGADTSLLRNDLEESGEGCEITQFHPDDIEFKTYEEVRDEWFLDVAPEEPVDMNAPEEANYPEDYEADEDLCYICKCGECKKFFLGNKGRSVCKICSSV